MAIAVSNVLAGDLEVNVTDWTMPTSLTAPVAGELQLAGVLTFNPGEVPNGLSGAGVTWVQVATALSSNIRLTLYRAMGAGSTGALTVDMTNQQVIIGVWVDKATGVDTSGANGAGAVVQSATGTGSSTSWLATLAAFGDAVNNVAYGAFVNLSGGAVTVGAGFTQRMTYSEFGVRVFSESKLAEDTSVDATGDNAAWVAIAVEIKMAASAQPITDRHMPRGLGRGFGRALAMARDQLSGLWRPKDTRLVIPVGISLQGA